jgi:A/G-specific adenine glycosylase
MDRSSREGDGRAAGATPGAAWIAALRSALLAFYDARRRPLPWHGAGAYRVWVSEVMLQQTRVEAVIPYYDRWLRRFPTLDALADAPLDDVLATWQGLGYYARARNLHRAAAVVRERHGGELPADPAALRALPGVGDYTAGALASIVHGLPEPAVDGNARRVLSRLLDVPAPTVAPLRPVAAALVPGDRPGDFNQALMELGAAVCRPRSPRCDACPAAALCRARARGTVALRPGRRPRREVPHRMVACLAVLSADHRLLLTRRPPRGLLGGLWELPAEPLPAPLSELLAAAPLHPLGALPDQTHAFTHLRLTYRCRVVRRAGPPPRVGPDAAWVPHAELPRRGLPVAQRRLAEAALLRAVAAAAAE